MDQNENQPTFSGVARLQAQSGMDDVFSARVSYGGLKTLTHTQVEIMDALVNGATIKQVAMMRKITRRTIVKHLCSIRERLGASTRDQAVYMFTLRYAKEEK